MKFLLMEAPLEYSGHSAEPWNWPRAIRWSWGALRKEEVHWHAVEGATRPTDGEQVLARQLYESEPILVVFRATPVARWLATDAIYPFKFFAQWRRI